MGRPKPLERIQLVRVQPGQRRSGQAGSEPCLSPGDRRGRSVGSEEAGREGSAPKSFTVADVDAVSLAEDSIRTTATARSLGAAGVPSPGHAFTGILQEPGRPPASSRKRQALAPPDRKRARPRLVGMRWPGEQTKHPAVRYRAVKGDQRRPGRVGGVVRLHSTGEGGEPGGTGTHWREGGNRPTHRSRET